MHVDKEHLQQWVSSGRAELVAADVAREFGDYLNSLPWATSGMHLDWTLIAHKVVRWDGLTDDEVAAQAADTRVARHPNLLAFYAPGECALLVSYDEGIRNIDYLYWLAPGPRYVCGAERQGETVRLACADFLEFDHLRPLRFTV